MGRKLVIAEGYEALVRDLGFDEPRSVVLFEGEDIVSKARKSRVIRFTHPSRPGETFFLKWYINPGIRRKFTSTYRLSRAETEFLGLMRLGELGIPTARPLAFGAFRRFLVLRLCFLITEAIPGATTIESLLACSASHGLPGPLPPRGPARRAAVTRLGALIGSMHRGGFRHGDLYLRNILVTSTTAGPAFHMIDAPHARLCKDGRGAERLRIHDLACLEKGARRFVSRSDRLRFFRAYLAAAGIEDGEGRLRSMVIARALAKTAESRATASRRGGSPDLERRKAAAAESDIAGLAGRVKGSSRGSPA